jgi:hypothetical protein
MRTRIALFYVYAALIKSASLCAPDARERAVYSKQKLRDTAVPRHKFARHKPEYYLAFITGAAAAARGI